MATVVQAPAPLYPQSSLRGNAGSPVESVRPPLSTTTSFEVLPNGNATPTSTRPSSQSQHQLMPFNLGSFGSNGVTSQQGTPRAQIERSQGPPAYPEVHQPQIYTAVYSNVSVYEMEVMGVAVMRRRADSWLNATQILKVAGIDKGKRTKVLEKEILTGEHEKVQGGYGRYQGTWINYNRGRDFCQAYGVEELLRPLLEYDMGQDGISVAGRGNIDTPTKEQAMAAQRKRNMMNGGMDLKVTQSPNGTFFKNISKTAVNAVSALNRARYDSPVPRPQSTNRGPSSRRPSQQIGSQDTVFAGSSQQSMHTIHSEESFSQSQSRLDPALRDSRPYYTNGPADDANEPPRKRARPSSSHDPRPHINGYGSSMQDLTPTEPNDSFFQRPQSRHDQDIRLSGLQPLAQAKSESELSQATKLTSLFTDTNRPEFTRHEDTIMSLSDNLDVPIDSHANTALHWAGTLARTSLIRALVARGANIFRLNAGGETALVRAATTTNNHDNSSFPELLELLGPSIEVRDHKGRTILHHIATTSGIDGRGPASRYYLASLLAFVVNQGSTSNSQQSSFGNAAEPLPLTRSIGLARFMSDLVNAVDKSGDTALNLAVKVRNRSVIEQLLEVGANPAIPNRTGFRPIDFGIGEEGGAMAIQRSSQISRDDPTPLDKVAECSQELANALHNLINESQTSFKSEIQVKQSLIDQTHARLREESSILADERRRLDDLTERVKQRKATSQQIGNLQRANYDYRQQWSRAGNDPKELREDVKIGDADTGLEIDQNLIPPNLLDNLDPSKPLSEQLSPAQLSYLSSLRPASILAARQRGYAKTNTRLEARLKDLRSRSGVLEGQMRQVLALCTGLSEDKVESTVEALMQAVESEREEDLDMVRLRGFLRMIDSDGPDGVDDGGLE